MSADLGPVSPTRRTVDAPIRAGGQTVGTLGDFWSWSCSDLANNTLRGALAEYIVATALGAALDSRIGWDSVDLRTPEGWQVEVKSSAYLQSWAQEKLTTIDFGIAPTVGWDSRTGTYGSEPRRHADVYVFCLLHHEDKPTLDPSDLDQWTFYVLPTVVLDEQRPTQRTIRLSSLLSLGPTYTGYAGLRDTVASAIEQNPSTGART